MKMLVVYSSMMLRPIVERAIIEAYEVDPANLTIDHRHFMKTEPTWEVSAQFEAKGARHDLRVFIDSHTGRVRKIEQIGPVGA